MKKQNSENFQDYCVFYKDKELPAIHKTDKFMKALILDSIKDQEHPLNQLIEKQTFVPFINERDSMGRLISSESYHRKRKSEASSLFNSPKNSHVFISKNSISNTCSIYENQLPAAKLKLKIFWEALLKILNYFNPLYWEFNSKRPQYTLRTHKNNSLQNKLPQFVKEQNNKEFKFFKQPTTPQATRFYKSSFVIEMFNQNKIAENRLQYILLMEKVQKLQTELLKIYQPTKEGEHSLNWMETEESNQVYYCFSPDNAFNIRCYNDLEEIQHPHLTIIDYQVFKFNIIPSL